MILYACDVVDTSPLTVTDSATVNSVVKWSDSEAAGMLEVGDDDRCVSVSSHATAKRNRNVENQSCN